MNVSQEFLSRVIRMLNVFENDSGSPDTDYSTIYIYYDGKGGRKQITLGRGFTDDGGSLKKVIERYISKQGAQSELFKTKLNRFGTGTLVNDKEFITALKSAALEKQMQDAQDEVFHEVYIQPALTWAATHKFDLPLSIAVIIDSYLHSGGMLNWLMNRFPDKKPDAGGAEKQWIAAYCGVRFNWLKNASSKLLRNTAYRPQFFLNQIAANNWEFKCPLFCNESQIC